MNEVERDLFEKRLLSIARGLEYPRTPDIAGKVMLRLRPAPRPRFASRRLAWTLAVIALLFTSLMAVPTARAAILEFIQIGVVRILGGGSTPEPTVLPEVSPTAAPITATPAPTSQPLIPILESLSGEMSLEQAQRVVRHPILLPAYPPELGAPDRVFVQDADGQMTVLVWLDPLQPGEVLMSLHFLPAGSWAITKFEPTLIRETSVHDAGAVWTVGPYPLQLSGGGIDVVRLVDGHVLIWTEGGITYRLETDLSMEAAVRIAESLEPIP